MQRLSNHTKAVLFSENLLEQQVMRRDNATVIMHLDYTLGRPRNDFGTPYGRMSGSKMLVTVRVGTRDNKEYYERLTMNESQTFTIVFNATYDEWGMLANYESATVVEGYIVGITENYDSDKAAEQSEQMTLEFSFLLTSITYIGENDNNLTLNFVN